jgi:hypothetical protein
LAAIIAYEVAKLFGVKMAVEEIGYQLQLFAQQSDNKRVRFDQQGRGIQDYVALFFYLHHPAYKILLIDEPENSLPPQLQRLLIRRIRAVTQEEGKQVFLCTHSPVMVLPERISDLEGIFIMRPFDPQPNIVSLASAVPGDEVARRRFESYLPNLDSAIAELMFSRGVLVVEGPTERQLINYLATRTRRDPYQADISILESGGLELMPGLIRLVRAVIPHWRALADSDLLSERGTRWVARREEMGSALGLPAIGWVNNVETRRLLDGAGLDVLPVIGVEKLYKSTDAQTYGDLSHVAPKDKGWLMERELSRIAALTTEQIESDYSELLRPLDEVRSKVKATSFEGLSLVELMRDYLQDDGLKIHRVIHRNRLDATQSTTHTGIRDLLMGYNLEFISYEDYSLLPKGIRNLRIECKGVQVKIVEIGSTPRVVASATIEGDSPNPGQSS